MRILLSALQKELIQSKVHRLGCEIFNLQNATIVFLEEETYFPTLLKRPVDPGKRRKVSLLFRWYVLSLKLCTTS